LEVGIEAGEYGVMRDHGHGLSGRRDRREDEHREHGGSCGFGHGLILPTAADAKAYSANPEWQAFAPLVKVPAPP
jgi:hypothetical protein